MVADRHFGRFKWNSYVVSRFKGQMVELILNKMAVVSFFDLSAINQKYNTLFSNGI